jgi:hypothetical protein
MISEAHACSYQLHTTRPYLTNRTYRENAEALPQAHTVTDLFYPGLGDPPTRAWRP